MNSNAISASSAQLTDENRPQKIWHRAIWLALAGPLLFCILNISGTFGSMLINNGEVEFAVRLCLSAYRALQNGEIPLIFANDNSIVLRPIFLFYTPIFYGTAGLLQFTGLDAHQSLLIVICMIAFSLSTGTYKAAVELGADRRWAALIGSTVPFSPYFLTDFLSRGAYVELTAWALLPWVIYLFTRLLKSPTFPIAVLFALIFSVFVISHKIFAGWTTICLALLAVLLIGLRETIARSPVILLSVAAALALNAPYWLNAALLGKELRVVDISTAVMSSDISQSLSVLWPFEYTLPKLKTGYGRFNLQVGPIVVIGLALSLFFLRRSRALIAVLAVTVLAILMTTSFFGFLPVWSMLPFPLVAIQFPYRMLVFAITFGSILAAIALGFTAKKSERAAKIVTAVGCTILLVSFWWNKGSSGLHVANIKNIEWAGASRDYMELKSSIGNASPIVPEKLQAFRNEAQALVKLVEDAMTTLPIQYSRNLSVTVNGTTVIPQNMDGLLALPLKAGMSSITAARNEPITFAASLPVSALAFGALLLALLPRKRQLNQSSLAPTA